MAKDKKFTDKGMVDSGFVKVLRSKLAIDSDNMDLCLQEQPDLFWHVSQQYVHAAADRDTLKLDIEDLQGNLDQRIRKDAALAEEKTTEAGITMQIKSDKNMRELQRKFLEAKVIADEWAAMKEAFQQRSFMMREMVALRLGEMRALQDSGLNERAQSKFAADKSDRIREEAGAKRRQLRKAS